MHIGKNVIKKLWRILDGRSEKERIVKIFKDIQEGNHAMKYAIQFHSNEDQININSLPSMLIEHQRNVVKEFMQKIKFLTGFCANMKNIITKKGDFAGVKTNHLVYLHEGNYYGMHIIIFILTIF